MANNYKVVSRSKSLQMFPTAVPGYILCFMFILSHQCDPHYFSTHAFSISTSTIPSAATKPIQTPSFEETDRRIIQTKSTPDESRTTFSPVPFFFATKGGEIGTMTGADIGSAGATGMSKSNTSDISDHDNHSKISTIASSADDFSTVTFSTSNENDKNTIAGTKKCISLFFADEICQDREQLNPNKDSNKSSKSKPPSKSVYSRRPSFLPRKRNAPLFFADEVVDLEVENEQYNRRKENEFTNNIIPLPKRQNQQQKQADEPMIASKITSLQAYQERSKPIVKSFQPKEYHPHPLLANEHLQTILGVFMRDDPDCAYINPNARNTFEELFPVAKAFLSKLPGILGIVQPESTCEYWDDRERIRTNDGDFFDVDFKYVKNANYDGHSDDSDSDNSDTIENNNESEGIVIIVHGLESNSNSSVCVNMARSFHSHNLDVACINFRGCSGTPNDTLIQYHGGFTDDVTQLIQLLSERYSGKNVENVDKKPIYISGFSLGANIVLKCIGELSMDAVTKYNLRGAAVTAAPFHLRPHHRRLIDEPVQRLIYTSSLLKSMKTKLDDLVDQFFDGDVETDKLDYWKIKNATTIAEIEDFMIAPLYGFKDKFDYFEKSASLPLTDDIAVPTFVLNSCDDPFFSETFFPWDKDCEKGGVAPLKLVRTPKGGHLGHMFHINRPNEHEGKEGKEEKPVASFALSELGRFINHVHTEITNN